MTVTSKSVLTLAPHATFRTVGSGAVLLDTKSGHIYSCNETAQDFLGRLDGSRDVAEISRAMTEDYEVTENELS